MTAPLTDSGKKALILIAQGTEEIEFVVVYDVFVRAGIKTVSALVGPSAPSVKASRGVVIVPDTELSSIADPSAFDILVIPGGADGTRTISKDSTVQSLVRDFIAKDKLVGMICAGTVTALESKLPRQPITSHPGVKSLLEGSFDYSEDSVVESGKLITSRGPGTTFAFALKLVEVALGKAQRDEVAGPMVFPPGGSLV